MAEDVLQQVVKLIEADPHSGPGLNLYALVSTLKMEKGGYMYMLRKLRDLSPEVSPAFGRNRRLICVLRLPVSSLDFVTLLQRTVAERRARSFLVVVFPSCSDLRAGLGKR